MSQINKLKMQLEEQQAHLNRYNQALQQFRNIAALNVFSETEIPDVCRLVGKVVLGHWQLEQHCSITQHEIDNLTPSAPKKAARRSPKGKTNENNTDKGNKS